MAKIPKNCFRLTFPIGSTPFCIDYSTKNSKEFYEDAHFNNGPSVDIVSEDENSWIEFYGPQETPPWDECGQEEFIKIYDKIMFDKDIKTVLG